MNDSRCCIWLKKTWGWVVVRVKNAPACTNTHKWLGSSTVMQTAYTNMRILHTKRPRIYALNLFGESVFRSYSIDSITTTTPTPTKAQIKPNGIHYTYSHVCTLFFCFALFSRARQNHFEPHEHAPRTVDMSISCETEMQNAIKYIAH